MKLVQKMVIIISLTLAQNVLAEESSVFGGIEVGVSVAGAKGEYVGDMWGILVGYKQFFSERVGLRYYLDVSNVDLYYVKALKVEAPRVVHYGANMDFLGNFISNKNIDFGAFVGVGAGVDMWNGGGFWYRKHNIVNVALNIGLRVNIAKHHGIEIVQRVQYNPIVEQGVSSYYPSVTSLRYTFSFGRR